MILQLQQKSVSIIICTYNRCESLRQTLESLVFVRVPENIACELIVVDNASSDRTAEVIQSCTLPNMPVRYIYESRRGLAHARNTGIMAAQGEIILFTDDDTRPPYNWIEGMCAPILSGKAQAVAGSIKIAPHLERPWMGPIHRQYFAAIEFIDREPPKYMNGANMAFAKEVLARVPGFDPEIGPGALGYGDDTLFTWQLSAAGYRIVSAFDVAVDHHFNVAVEHHFDESRLLRSAFLNSAKKAGLTQAYIDHHWKHSIITLVWLRLVKHVFHLVYWRVKNRREFVKSEGMPEGEWETVKFFYYYKHYLTERKRARNYEKHGLVKLTHI